MAGKNSKGRKSGKGKARFRLGPGLQGRAKPPATPADIPDDDADAMDLDEDDAGSGAGKAGAPRNAGQAPGSGWPGGSAG